MSEAGNKIVKVMCKSCEILKHVHHYECAKCGEKFPYKNTWKNYCPNCGKKLRHNNLE